jgi:hypothetical protein
MSIIKGKGAPSSKTKGFIGDTYINELTGKEYQCVNACTIRIHSGESSTYTWAPVDSADAEPVEEVKVEEPAEEVVEEKVEEPVAEVKEEVVDEVKEKKSKRTNYNAMSK